MPHDVVCAAGSICLAGVHSPDLNPIEMAFAKLKALIRKAAARTYDQLWAAVSQICDLFSDEECYNYFSRRVRGRMSATGSRVRLC